MCNDSLIRGLSMLLAVSLAACSSSDSDNTTGTSEATTSEFNPDLTGTENTGEPGGDITAIAGLWDGSTVNNDTTDIIYWNFSANGVLTRYDYQQDGAPASSGENCYIVDDPITVTPEGDNDYSINNVAVTATVNGESLTISFLEPDVKDLDANRDTEESPTFTWTNLSSPVLDDLNSCSTDPDTLSRAECVSNGGTVVADIGDGTMFQPQFRCESGLPPIAQVIPVPGEPIADEGEVCCI